MERKHKIIIGSFSTLLIIYIIANSILLYILFIKIDLNQKTLEEQIMTNQIDTQNKITELTENLLQTQETLGSLGTQISKLKATTSADFSGIIGEAVMSVVTIRTDVSQGTGFIISRDGYVVTNAHLLAGARKVQAITSNQEIINADFIGYNGDLDIALLRIIGSYNPFELSNSDEIQIGEKVIAIGNPLGLQFSASEGIISGVHRPGPSGLEAYIQTDAALNPGNSGGPLINKEGEVIGINNFKIGGTEGIGFALESNYIKSAVNSISMAALNQTLIN